MNKSTCSFPDCIRPAYAKGLCRAHYSQQWKGQALHPLPVRRGDGALCKVEGCDRELALEKLIGHGMCGLHYQRWQKHGDPLYERQTSYLVERCTLPGCAGLQVALGYCGSCVSRLYRTGTVERRVVRYECWTCGVEFEANALPRVSCSQPCRDAYRAAADHYRRALRRGELPGSEVFTREEIGERDGWVCGICLEHVDRSLKFPNPASASLDHVIPLRHGGSHTRQNCQVAHFSCNSSKGARLDVSTES